MDEYKQYEPLWGSWYIKELLGEGGFGKVYRIERQEYGHIWNAALKVITMPQNKTDIDSIASETSGMEGVRSYLEEIVNDIVNECVTMSRFKGNSYIVSYEDHMVVPHRDEIGWDIFIRMELLEPLNHYTAHFDLKREAVIQMGIDLCKGLELCHHFNIIHRDIKPENIFLSEQGSFKIGDFGVSRTVEKSCGFLSKKGTPSYMAPELYKGEESDKTVDIYSMGILLYRFMNQKRLPFMPPYPQQITYRDREMALKRRLMGEAMPKPSHADPVLAQAILKACAYLPGERYQTAREMWEKLEKIQRPGAGIPAGWNSGEDKRREEIDHQAMDQEATIGMTEYEEYAAAARERAEQTESMEPGSEASIPVKPQSSESGPSESGPSKSGPSESEPAALQRSISEAEGGRKPGKWRIVAVVMAVGLVGSAAIGVTLPKQKPSVAKNSYETAVSAAGGKTGHETAENTVKNTTKKEAYDESDVDVAGGETIFRDLLKTADAGDAEAQLKVAGYYENGKIWDTYQVDIDYEKAIQYYQKAADMGDGRGWTNLGILYTNGTGVGQDYARAREYYQKAADMGDGRGWANLGILYEKGYGVEQDYDKAQEYYQKAADMGEGRGWADLGQLYDNGYGVVRDTEEALTCYQKAGDMGDGRGYWLLGVHYERGNTVEQDYEKARDYYEKAGGLGYAAGWQNLAALYDLGNGVSPDYAKAMEYYQKAADAGSALGWYYIGCLYERGEGVPQDYVKALSYYEKAGESGEPSGYYSASLLYAFGKGVPQSYEREREFIQRVIESEPDEGYPWSCMGDSYYREGGTENYTKAIENYTRAIDLHDVLAWIDLGQLYEHGLEDTEKAKECYQKAAEAGVDSAQMYLDDLEKSM